MRGNNKMNQESAEQVQTRAASSGEAVVLKLEEFLPYRLNVCAVLVSQALSRIYSERYRLGVPEWRVLVTLGQYGMMTGKQIGIHSTMHKTKVSRAVALLEKRKLVTRRANRDDLREAFLSLTPAGQDIYNEAAPLALEFGHKILEVIDLADRPALDRALKRLTDLAIDLAKGAARR